MTMAFDPHHVSVLANLIFDLEEELAFDGPLSSTTRTALARRVIDLAAAGETDPQRIKARVLNRKLPVPRNAEDNWLQAGKPHQIGPREPATA